MLDLEAIKARLEQPGIDTLIEDACAMVEEIERLRANEPAIKAIAHANEAITNTLMTAIKWVFLDGADSDKLLEGIDLCTRLLANARAAALKQDA